jgi:type II secretory ATPase GspE/PulE/Tfp pilus assembly ATPase PilB-like protein
MVGEIRDRETADIAIRASLTGHLVFSTLHTNDAPGAITRLVDMGIEPFLVASAIELVIAQRLVRRLCPECARPEKINRTRLQDSLRVLGCDPAAATGVASVFSRSSESTTTSTNSCFGGKATARSPRSPAAKVCAPSGNRAGRRCARDTRPWKRSFGSSP